MTSCPVKIQQGEKERERGGKREQGEGEKVRPPYKVYLKQATKIILKLLIQAGIKKEILH